VAKVTVSRDLLLDFGTSYISLTTEITNFKYGMLIDYKEYYPKRPNLS